MELLFGEDRRGGIWGDIRWASSGCLLYLVENEYAIETREVATIFSYFYISLRLVNSPPRFQ